ncbi:unnamed protein product [Prorocentrum cordatum]|uniref:Uncharacterized protein n=1 Tax=Prorocentrum cordatum TaxID=2364126 RepID=A0ABN9UDC8_9DINO|nr:unnamed protein product [Polarella glacialis]CAK0857448.1 unnamed protein product [Polarella glacialis]
MLAAEAAQRLTSQYCMSLEALHFVPEARWRICGTNMGSRTTKTVTKSPFAAPRLRGPPQYAARKSGPLLPWPLEPRDPLDGSEGRWERRSSRAKVSPTWPSAAWLARALVQCAPARVSMQPPMGQQSFGVGTPACNQVVGVGMPGGDFGLGSQAQGFGY